MYANLSRCTSCWTRSSVSRAQLYQQPQAASLRHATSRSASHIRQTHYRRNVLPHHEHVCSRRSRHQVHAAAVPNSSGGLDGSSSSNTGSTSSSGNSTPLQAKPYTPPPLNPSTAQQLQKTLVQLLPKPPASTPLAPFVSLLLPFTQPLLHQWHPGMLLGSLQLCTWAGLSPGPAWVDAWAAAVQQQLPNLQSETACQLVYQALQLKQQSLPADFLDTLFIAALKDVESCSGRNVAMALAAVALVELSSGVSSSSRSSSSGYGGSGVPAFPDSKQPLPYSSTAAAAASSAGERLTPPGIAAAAVAAAAAAAVKPPDFSAADAAAPPQSFTLADIAAANSAKAAAASAADAGANNATASSTSSEERPSSFASLISSSTGSTTGSERATLSSSSTGTAGRTSSSSTQPPVGPLSSWEELAAAAADLKDDAAAATAKQKQAYAAEAAAAGAAAAARSSSSSSNTETAAGAAAAGFWLGSNNSSSHGSSASSNISLASWMVGNSSSGSSGSGAWQQQQQLDSFTQLLPIVLYSWVDVLSKGGRMQQLQADQLVMAAAAVAALQLKLPAGWMDSFCAALQQQLPRMSAPALCCLSTCLPLLVPVGGSLRLWRKLGVVVQQQEPQLSSEQLCELLPLVQAADLAVSVDWMTAVLNKIQASIQSLTLPQSSRALVSAVALGCKPPKPWLDCYMQRFKTGLSELNPEGLVDVLRAMAAAGALPSHDWLVEMEEDVGRRFGFIGPVELSTTAFLFANLAHIPSDTWKQRFMAESLKFRVYYTGPDLTQLVWSAVRLGCKPEAAWLQAYADQMRQQLSGLQAYQLAFTFAALQTLGAPLSRNFIDEVLDAFALQLGDASPSDTALLLVTVARLQHVSSYRWLDEVLDSVQAHMVQYDAQELVTLLWSLAQLHHQPGPEWLAIFCEAASPQLASMTGSQLGQLMWAFGQLQWTPPGDVLDPLLAACQARLATDDIPAQDAATLLSSLAALNHTPPEAWLHSCLNLLYWRLRELDPEGLASLVISLAKLNVVVSDGPFLDAYISMTTARLSSMSPQTQVQLLSALALFGADLPRAWVAAFQLTCVKQAEEGSMTAEQLEQVLVALASRGQQPSSALCQLYYDASLPQLPNAEPSSIATVLQALSRSAVQPDAVWLECLVSVVRNRIRAYSLLQLNVVAKALSGFQAGGMQQPWLRDFVSYLKEFFLH